MLCRGVDTIECFGDAGAGGGFLAMDALGVGGQQHLDGMPGPLGHERCVYASVQPGGQAGVPQVVGALTERGGDLRRPATLAREL